MQQPIGFVVLVVACLCATGAAAQSLSVSGTGGLGMRSEGNVNVCCGAFESTLEPPVTSWWFSGAVTKMLSPRVGIDGDVSWQHEPEYAAYFSIPGVPGNHADNDVRALTIAGLLRLRAWSNATVALDVVAGAGWMHETRTSNVETVALRPLPGAGTVAVGTFTSNRNLLPVVLGAEMSAGRSRIKIFATARVHLVTGTDDARTDLELGRQILRFGVGIRSAF